MYTTLPPAQKKVYAYKHTKIKMTISAGVNTGGNFATIFSLYGNYKLKIKYFLLLQELTLPHFSFTVHFF